MVASSLRERNRLAAMREIQRVALDLFVDQGFEAVKVEDIAAAAGVSASTIYRYFGTKERVVVWEELDAAFSRHFEACLANQAPVDAFRDTLVNVVAPHYERDKAAQLRRIAYIYGTPQLHAAVVEQELEDRRALSEAFSVVMTERDDGLSAQVLAAVCLSALDVAVDCWQRNHAKQPLVELIDKAFAALETHVG